MSALARLALNAQWSMSGVERPEGNLDLPMPSIMHLKQGHYVALLRADRDAVLVDDPIFGVRHFRRDVLNAESSGRFLLDPSLMPAGWRLLSPDEMAATVGRSGVGFTYPDQEEGDCGDCGCPGNAAPSPPLAPGHGGSGGDGGGVLYGRTSSCTSCGGGGGMPQWRVTEPNINLWLRDKPISCQPAYGPAAALDLQFKQRDELWSAWDTFSFGPSWNSHWLSHACCDTRYGLADATRYLPGEGWWASHSRRARPYPA